MCISYGYVKVDIKNIETYCITLSFMYHLLSKLIIIKTTIFIRFRFPMFPNGLQMDTTILNTCHQIRLNLFCIISPLFGFVIYSKK